MGGSESTRRRASTTNASSTSWIPTLRFKHTTKGPNVQQDEQINWLLQVWRDDSFMFRVQTTVKVPKDFKNPHSEVSTQIVQEITYYGSGGRVVLTNAHGVQVPDYKIGKAFSQLMDLHKAEQDRKLARSKGDVPLETYKPFYLSFRTQRCEFNKRHQRPAHIADTPERERKRSIIVPDSHGLVSTAIVLDPAQLAKMDLNSADAPPSIRINKPKAQRAHISTIYDPDATEAKVDKKKLDAETTTAILTPDLEEAFDWEWEGDGVIDEQQSVQTELTNIPQLARFVDLIVPYLAPQKPTVEVAPRSNIPSGYGTLIPSRLRGASVTRPTLDGAFADPGAASSSARTSPTNSPNPTLPRGGTLPPRAAPLPPRANSIIAAPPRKRNATDADYIASAGALHLFAEINARADTAKLTAHLLSIKPPAVRDLKGATRIDPDVDVSINFIKEPTPEPVTPPRLEFEGESKVELQLEIKQT